MNTKYKLQHYPCGLKVGEKLRMIGRPEPLELNKDSTEEEDLWTVLSGDESEPEVIWLLDDYGDKSIWNAEIVFDHFKPIQ